MVREMVVDTQHIAWLPWAVQYFFYIGIAAASVLVGSLIHYFYKGKNKDSIELILISLAAVGAIVGPMALTADLHQPGRAWHFYPYMHTSSWMSMGSWILPVFVVFTLLYFVFLIRALIPIDKMPKLLKLIYIIKLDNNKMLKIARLLAIFGMVVLFTYTTMEVFVLKSRPLWHTYWLGPMIISSAIPPAVLFARYLLGIYVKDFNSTVLHKVVLLSLVVFLVSIFGFYNYSAEVTHEINILIGANSLALLPLLFLVLTFLSYFVRNKNCNKAHLLSAIFSILFAWSVRWFILMQVQTIPKYNALMEPYSIPWGDDGILGIASMIGLFVFTAIIVFQVISYYFNNSKVTS